MDVVYFSIIPTFEPSRYCKCWIVCFHYKYENLLFSTLSRVYDVFLVFLHFCRATGLFVVKSPVYFSKIKICILQNVELNKPRFTLRINHVKM